MIKKIAFAVLMLAAPLFAATAQTVENNSQASAQQDDDAKYATELLKPGTEAPDFALATPDGKVVVSTVMKDKIAAKLAEIMPGCDEQSACCKKTTCCKKATTCKNK